MKLVHNSRPKRAVVPPVGPRNAKIVVLGEAPGRQEEKLREPFMGPSGGILWDDIMRGAGIHKSQVLCLNTCWVRPPNNKLHALPEKTLQKYRDKTWRVIREHPRDVVIAVGGTALKFLVGESQLAGFVGERLAYSDGGGITLMRGSPVMSLFGHRVIPMLHPAALLHERGARYRDIHLSQLDAKKADRWANGNSEIPLFHIFNFERVHRAKAQQGFEPQQKTFLAFRDYLTELSSAPILSFDIETFADTITVIGLADTPRTGISIPLTGEFTLAQEVELLTIVKSLLEGPALKVAQNVEFDADYLRGLGIGVKHFFMDTLHAHQLVHPETRHSLANLVSLYTDQPYYKDMTKDQGWNTYNEALWDYNAMDCCLTLEVAYKLLQELHQNGALGLYETRSRNAHIALMTATSRGVLIDQAVRSQRRLETEACVKSLHHQLKFSWHETDLFGPKGHLSPQKIAQAMRSQGVKTYLRDATNEESIKLYIKKYPNHRRGLQRILDCRENETLLSRYLGVRLDPKGRFRSRFHPFTDTGRTGSTEHFRPGTAPKGSRWGSNVQNIPLIERVYFVPDPGLVWWETDASQIEARITARWFYDEKYILDFTKPCPDCHGKPTPDCRACEGRGTRDIHLQAARQLFANPTLGRSDKIKRTQFTYRDIGKRAVHAMNYGATEHALSKRIAVEFPGFEFTIDDARRFVAIFRSHRSGVIAGWQEIKDKLRKSRRLQTPYGRVRWFHDRWGDALFRAAIAWGPQSIAADHIAGAYSTIHRRIERLKHLHRLHPQTYFLIQVHDSISGQCHPDEVEFLRDEVVLPAMGEPIPLYYKDSPLICPADFSWGDSWKAAKP